MPLVDIGAVGSPTDVATFVLVLVMLVLKFRPRIETLAAAVVALAERRDDVDDDRLRDELDVADREVEALRPRIVYKEGADD